MAEKVEATWIRDLRPGGTRSMERARNEGGTLNRTSIVWFAENPTLGSKKHLNPGNSAASIQGVPSEYDFYAPRPVDSPFLIFNSSQHPEERRKENENGGQGDRQWVDW